MVAWDPPVQYCRIRNGRAVSAAAGSCTVTLDGTQDVAGVPVYGPMPSVGQGVLVLEQGGSLLVLGDVAALMSEVEELRSRVAAMEAGWRDGES